MTISTHLQISLLRDNQWGLSGEVRSVNMAAQRVAEAEKLGFEICVVPKVCVKNIKTAGNMKVIGVSNIQEAIDLVC